MERLTLEVTGGGARLTLSAPRRGEPIDSDWAHEFCAAAVHLQGRAELRVEICSSEGGVCCAGDGADARRPLPCPPTRRPGLVVREITEDAALESPAEGFVASLAAGPTPSSGGIKRPLDSTKARNTAIRSRSRESGRRVRPPGKLRGSPRRRGWFEREEVR